MSLIKRESSADQLEANHANSLHPTGPRSEQGKAVASRNARKPRAFAKIAARSLCVLRERPTEFERMRQALSEAMAPRDAWEVAWVQDIAILRWRLARLQRAEVGVLAVRKQQLAGERKRKNLPASGLDDLNLRQQIPVVGFTGLPDSPWKFQQVLEFLHQLWDLVRFGDFEKENADADLLLPREELDDLMRYETHLEVQIERKLRQFYARRHEATVRPAETVSAAVEESAAGALVRQVSAGGLSVATSAAPHLEGIDEASAVPHLERNDAAASVPHLEGGLSATMGSNVALAESQA